MVQHVSVSCPASWLIDQAARGSVNAAATADGNASTSDLATVAGDPCATASTVRMPRDVDDAKRARDVESTRSDRIASDTHAVSAATAGRAANVTALLSAGTCISSTLAHQDFVLFASWAPSGQLIASASYDNSVKVWRFDAHHGNNIASSSTARASPTRLSLATPSALTLWRHFTGHTNAVRAVVFTADEQFVISGSWDGTVRVWCLQRGLNVRTLQTQSGLIYGVLRSPSNDSFIFSAVRYSLAPAFHFVRDRTEIVCSDEPGTRQFISYVLYSGIMV